ncbi:virulence factor Mce family protein [Mycolicibacterium sp. jd]|uniref:MlaD family protein n=1 Tax=Mycolicibacterium austroafricanum TaxID=39687 RepID=A0ABT8HM63_MYCAO|nr:MULTISPECIES: MlaD family protein [Mycolicibacterium]MDN4521843.1 MlaD family protein [Mycolicibacterium austroafricanum]UJL30592.1 MCE family protein [Mycolicibacterium vanbaalenii]WND56302.1 MlaD family protein [Mycolicibacterium vanbaalenii]
MRITATAIKLAALMLVLLVFTAMIVVVFGQIRFDRTVGYSAEFSSVSGLREGQFVRASGVEVGKVKSLRLIDGGKRIRVDFDVDRSLPLYQSTTAHIRYANLIGERYLEVKRGENGDRVLPPGGVIPLERTQPALDLDALIGGFRPVFRGLDPEKVNTIASAIITVFQGQGGTINDILDQTARLTSALADRDEAIGAVVKNLSTVLDSIVDKAGDVDATIINLETLISGLSEQREPLADSVASLSDASGALADLLSENRPLLQNTVTSAQGILGPLVEQSGELDDLLHKLPTALTLLGRSAGTYGDFINLYLCDITLTLNGLQPGGPVRTVRLTQQPTGRCTPQ